MTFRVSVALATHNGEKYIGEQLLSILQQSRPVDQIVVSDDASHDRTVAIVESTLHEWEAAHGSVPELIVLRNHHALGVTANFEQALEHCTGDFVALSDQDDRWRSDKVQVLCAIFAGDPELELVHSDAQIVDSSGAPTGQNLLDVLNVSESERAAVLSGHAFDVLLRRNVVTGATVILRRTLVQRARPFPKSWVHDEWLAMLAAADGALQLCEESLIDYRQHDSNEIGVTVRTLGVRLARLKAPRTERNERLLARAVDLEAWLLNSNVESSIVFNAQQKTQHEKARNSYPRARLLRIIPVFREWKTGRYATYGLGSQDVLRDLVQPV